MLNNGKQDTKPHDVAKLQQQLQDMKDFVSTNAALYKYKPGKIAKLQQYSQDMSITRYSFKLVSPTSSKQTWFVIYNLMM